MKKVNNIKKAPIIQRAIAFGIDWYLSALCLNLAIIIVSSIYHNTLKMTALISDLPIGYALIALFLGISFVLLYFILPQLINEKYTGQTAGKILLKIKVVNITNEKVNLKTLFIRYGVGFILIEQIFNEVSYALRSVISIVAPDQVVTVFYYIFCIIGSLSLILMFIDKNGQMLHDKIAKTKVIETY